MSPATGPRPLGPVGLVLFLVVASATLLGSLGTAHGSATPRGSGAPTTLNGTVFAPAPGWAKGPDDLTSLSDAGLDHGRLVIWTAYQNGINPNGSAGTPGGSVQSTVAGYDAATGRLVRTINVTGKVDGLTGDPLNGRLIATVNEDDRSAMYVLYPGLGAVARYSYNPDPAVSGNGGTDSIAIWGGQIVIAHSNPNDTTQATDYFVRLDRSTMTAHLTPVFYDDSVAVNAVTGATVRLALTDPDTNFVMPWQSPRFAGSLATVSQADGKLIFASFHNTHVHLAMLNLTDNVTGNLPPIDGLAVATCGHGTLYVVDAGTGAIEALTTKGWPAGTVFVGEPNDNGNPLLGTLDLSTGAITPLGNHFVSPKGLLFVPGHC